jgi:hypothetical protein
MSLRTSLRQSQQRIRKVYKSRFRIKNKIQLFLEADSNENRVEVELLMSFYFFYAIRVFKELNLLNQKNWVGIYPEKKQSYVNLGLLTCWPQSYQ